VVKIKDIQIQENFLSPFLKNEIYSVTTSSFFPWFYSDQTSFDKKNKDINQFGFSNVIYDKHNNFRSENFITFFGMIPQIEEKFNVSIKEIIRIRAGLQTMIEAKNNIKHTPHVDYDFDHKTLLYYVNNSDGDTTFFNDNDKTMPCLSVTPKSNLAVFFNGNILHSSSSPKNTSRRIAININII
jgi:hypothetical protein